MMPPVSLGKPLGACGFIVYLWGSQKVADFCEAHPVGFAITLFIAAVPISIYSSEIKAFLRVPPQRLSKWVLKSRLAAVETRRYHIKRIVESQHYAAALQFRGLAYALISLIFVAMTCLVLISKIQMGSKTNFSTRFLIVSTIILAYCNAVSLVRRIALFNSALRPDQTISEAERKIESLKARINGGLLYEAPSPKPRT